MIDRINSLLWGPWTVVFVLIVGAWFTVSSRCLQISGIKLWWGETVGRISFHKQKKGEVSPFQSATAALAGTLGTGNIIGVAAAMAIGGAGAIFWMWVAAFFGMMLAFAENTLAVLTRKRDENGEWLGGPMIYIKKLLKMRPLASFWAIACAVAAFGVGNLTQVNAIAQSARTAWNIPPWATALVLLGITAPAVLGGVGAVVRFTEKLVPVMAAVYYLGCFAVIAVNYSRIPDAFLAIFCEAFSPSAAGGGFLGALLVGVRRGVFTNEAGLGSAAMVHASADCRSAEEQGFWGMFEVFFDTIICCTLTALVLLTSGAGVSLNHLSEPSVVTAQAFSCVLGNFSGSFLTVVLLLFSYATVLAWGIYGERAFGYLTGAKFSLAYKILYVLAIIPGCFMRSNSVWALSDTLNALMMIPNVIALALLWKHIRAKLPKVRRRSTQVDTQR